MKEKENPNSHHENLSFVEFDWNQALGKANLAIESE
jgi:hypothetical protein